MLSGWVWGQDSGGSPLQPFVQAFMAQAKASLTVGVP